MKKNNLSHQYFLKIQNIFESKNWQIEHHDSSLFEKFVKNFALLNDKQKDLIIKLTENYLWVKQDFYKDYLIEILNYFLTKEDPNKAIKTIYVVQLTSPQNKNKIKSSAHLLYSFNNTELRQDILLSNYKFKIIDNFDEFNYNLLNNSNSILLFIDDYIGSGDTAKSCIHSIKNLNCIKNKIFILSLVIHKSGYDVLNELNIPIYYKYIQKKGISDYFFGKELAENIKTMKKIEDKLEIKETFRFGYKQSEALVTMINTPNNTFPFFWYKNNSPFSRR